MHITAYEMRISDWSSDVCSSDLAEWRPEALDDGRIDTRRSEVVQLGAQVGDARRRLFGREIFAWCRLETHDRERHAQLVGPLARARDQCLMATMHAVEIADRQRTAAPIAWQIGRATVCTPVTNAQIVCRLLLAITKK